MGFISLALGAKNNFQANPAQLQTTDYGQALQQALSGNVVNNSQSDQTRAQQQQLIAALTASMNGQGPSLAQNMLNQATNQNVAQGASLMGSQRGINPALAARQILQNTAALNQGAAGQAATLRAQEQLGAMGQLGGELQGIRAGDLSQAVEGANATTGRIGILGGLQNAQNNSNISNTLGANQINAGVASGNAQINGNLVGGLVNGLAGMGAAAIKGGAGAACGGTVPGSAAVPGDSPANDTVPTMLSPGEIVVPRTAAKNSKTALEFIRHVKKAGGKGTTEARNQPEGYAKVIAAHRELAARLGQLEKLCYGGMAGR